MILGITLIAHELIKPFYRVIYYDHSIYEVFPIHICHLAALSMGIYILTKVKFFFEVAYFFGLTGNLLAMVTPDLDYSYPDPEFITYYFGHGLLFLTVFYVCICTDVKLTWWSVFRVFLFAACLLPAIYSLNMYLVGYYSDVNAGSKYAVRFLSSPTMAYTLSSNISSDLVCDVVLGVLSPNETK